EVNPTWSDEKLFQEARRIVIAQIQHITYNEFVPLIVGKDNLRKNTLDLQVNGHDSRYDMNIDGSTLNVYASVVGQFFLTLLPNQIPITDTFGNHKRDELLGKVVLLYLHLNTSKLTFSRSSTIRHSSSKEVVSILSCDFLLNHQS
ncbi:unnamed protein product, partial [Cylicostephanus goldi]